jgi:Cft2 family RNA processing exonuclease
MPWEIQQRKGLWLPQVGWWLDAQASQPRSIVTHAHSDHIARHREVICTRATSHFLARRLGRRRSEHILPFGQTEQLTLDCTVTLCPAGHILGSAMVLLQHERHGSLLYTGDFKLRPSRAAENCQPPRADVLVMETTFGLPRYFFPSAEKIEADIVGFCRNALEGGSTPVLYAYSLGKSQELLQVAAAAGLPVLLHRPAAAFAHDYQAAGFPLAAHGLLSPQNASGAVVICPQPMGGDNPTAWIHPRRTAVVSGWALDSAARYRAGADAAFPLSDHADFPELLRLVELVQPKLVYTVHGFAKEFAATLRERGVEAWALGRENQLGLALA